MDMFSHYPVGVRISFVRGLLLIVTRRDTEGGRMGWGRGGDARERIPYHDRSYITVNNEQLRKSKIEDSSTGVSDIEMALSE